MADRERNEQGQYASDLPDRIIEVMEPGETYRSGEIADELDVTTRAVTRRLNELEEAGEVDRIEVHSKLFVWQLSGD